MPLNQAPVIETKRVKDLKPAPYNPRRIAPAAMAALEKSLDCFGGSGSTLIACEASHRKARLAEIDPAYCDVIVQRWEALTGQKAVLLG